MERKNIYCPICKRKTGTIDLKSTINKITKCKKCNKLVIYKTDTKEIITKKVPPRNASSGTRFY